MMERTRNHRRILILLTFLAGYIILSAGWQQSNVWPTTHAQEEFSCASVTEIPEAECEALVAIYESADSSVVDGESDWFTTSSPCNWENIECEDGYITVLNLGQNGGFSGIPEPSLPALTTLPPQIGDLTHLEYLSLVENPITALPPEIGNLSLLETLDLRQTSLVSLPAQIGNLINLRILWISDTTNSSFAALPPEIGLLASLQELDVRNGSISLLPSEIGDLSNLELANFYDNDLAVLPATIGNLSSLQVLLLGNNQLSALPAEIGNLNSLNRLSLGDNRLTEFPAQIGNLSSLTELAVEGNSLSSVPTEISQLSSLQRLHLDEELQNSVPPELQNNPEIDITYWYEIEARSSSGGCVALWQNGYGPLYNVVSELYELGTVEALRLNAVPSNGYQFVRWESSEDSSQEMTDPELAISVSEAAIYTAYFTKAGDGTATVPALNQSNRIYLPLFGGNRPDLGCS